MALAVFLVRTASDCCLLPFCYNLCSLFAVLPCSLVDGTPSTLHLCVGSVTLRSSLFFVLVISVSAFPLVSCVVLAPPAGHRNAGVVFGIDLFCF